MASVSDNIRVSTGVFTTPLQIMSDEPASLSWLPDEDALDRPCRILFAIAVISDKAAAIKLSPRTVRIVSPSVFGFGKNGYHARGLGIVMADWTVKLLEQ